MWHRASFRLRVAGLVRTVHKPEIPIVSRTQVSFRNHSGRGPRQLEEFRVHEPLTHLLLLYRRLCTSGKYASGSGLGGHQLGVLPCLRGPGRDTGL
jgi:hypothetical protein